MKTKDQCKNTKIDHSSTGRNCWKRGECPSKVPKFRFGISRKHHVHVHVYPQGRQLLYAADLELVGSCLMKPDASGVFFFERAFLDVLHASTLVEDISKPKSFQGVHVCERLTFLSTFGKAIAFLFAPASGVTKRRTVVEKICCLRLSKEL